MGRLLPSYSGLMDNADRLNKFEKSLQRFWDHYLRTATERGFDLAEMLDRWVQSQKLRFHNPLTIADFDELCAHGCQPPVLMLLVVFVKNAPQLSILWASYLGQSRVRKSASMSLEAAASTLEEVFAKFIALENDAVRRQMEEFDRVPLTILISELRMYSEFLRLAEILKAGFETRSPVELARFLLTYYVGRATGRPHDRNVSSLLSEIQSLEVYDEVAQRMWRDRNYKRLLKHHQNIGEISCVLGVVVSRRT